jgi:hypothetical protein
MMTRDTRLTFTIACHERMADGGETMAVKSSLVVCPDVTVPIE